MRNFLFSFTVAGDGRTTVQHALDWQLVRCSCEKKAACVRQHANYSSWFSAHMFVGLALAKSRVCLLSLRALLRFALVIVVVVVPRSAFVVVAFVAVACCSSLCSVVMFLTGVVVLRC